MSAPNASPINVGKLTGTVYTFVRSGDELPAHVHDETDKHVTICSRGTVEIHSDKAGTIKLYPGAMYAFAPGEVHSIVALEPNARIFNIVY